MKKKNFDAVKMMREIRDKLTKRYLENPEMENSDLQKIRRKYKISVNKNRISHNKNIAVNDGDMVKS